MKKSLFMLGMAVAALTSCTQSDVLDIAESNVIKFDNAFVGKPTKAVTAPEVTTANIDKMYVFADNGSTVFDNKLVYKITGTNEWGYDNLVKWEAQKTYQFIAYAGKAFNGLDELGTITPNADNKSLKFENIVVNGTNQFDLLYSNNKEVATTSVVENNPMIDFTFEHLLSMVKFTLKSGFGATATVEVSDFKFYGFKTKGTYENSAWALSGNANSSADTDFKVTGPDIAKYNAAGSTDVVNSWVIIPQQNVALDKAEMVSFNVTVKDGVKTIVDNKAITAKIPSITWEKGNRYNYIFTITPEVVEIEDEYITFDAPKVTEWTNNDLTVDEGTSSTEGVEL